MSTGEPFDFNSADDDRPRRRRRDDDEDVDRSDRRSRNRYDDERDDFDDHPRRRGKKTDGLGMASMIIGICSCVVALPGLCCILFSGLSVIGGIVAVILGFIARSHFPESGTAKAGIITGFIGAGLSVAMVVLAIVLNVGMNLGK
jgi:hypothetical protein